jgi:hypothetical protein
MQRGNGGFQAGGTDGVQKGFSGDPVDLSRQE